MKDTIQVLRDFHPAMFIETEGPLVSLYLSTHPHSANDQQDRLMFKNLVGDAEALLREGYEKNAYQGILENLKAIEVDADRDIWRFRTEGLAVLLDDKAAYLYFLDYAVEEKVVVAESFHIKPLIRNFQYGAHYYALALSVDEFVLYYGDTHRLDEVVLPEDVKTKFSEVYDDFDSGTNSRAMSYGGPDPNYYGQGSKSDLVGIDREKFFRYVDKAVHDLVGDKQGCPLILVALPQNQAHFRELATIPTLLSQGIEKPFESLPLPELIREASAIITEKQKEKVAAQVNQFTEALSKQEASADLRTIGFALVERKVKALFVEEEKSLFGTFDMETGAVEVFDDTAVGLDDLTDDFAQICYLQDGEVYILDREFMPSDTGVAALFRY